MHNPSYLTLSEHRIYHFRWPIPQYLLPCNKRHYVKLSLRTREPQEAMYLSKGLSYAASSLLKQGRLNGMEYTEVKELLQTYLQRALKEIRETMEWKGTDIPEVKLYRLMHKFPVVHDYHHDSESERDSLLRIADKMELRDLEGKLIDESHTEWPHLQKCYRAAMPQFAKEVVRIADSLDNDFDFQPKSIEPEITDSSRMIVHPNAAMQSLSTIIRTFITTHVNDEAWDENTKDEKEAKFAVLLEILGDDMPVGDVDLVKAREVRDIIKQLPRNLNKNPLVRNLPLMQAIKVQEAEKISAVTAQKYLSTYQSFFQWCLLEGIIHDNPFAKVKASVDKKKRSAASRKPFNADQIKSIQQAVQNEGKHYRKWGTLIGMYTGARLNEIAQIMLDDIKQKDGIWYFHMNDEGENQRLKTSAARRFVPIHKALLEQGIIEEAQQLRQAGHTRFFHELTFCQKNGYGKKLSHYFNAVLLPKLDMKRKELVFHSFRHTANTCLYQAGVAEPIVHMLIGHERSGTSQQVYFKEGYTLQQLKDAMDSFDPAKIVVNSD